MTLARYSNRRDANEPEVIEALEKCGFAVDRVSAKGIPDLLVSRRGNFYPIEVKMPKGKPTKEQIEFRDRHKAPVPVLRSGIEATEWQRTVP